MEVSLSQTLTLHKPVDVGSLLLPRCETVWHIAVKICMYSFMEHFVLWLQNSPNRIRNTVSIFICEIIKPKVTINIQILVTNSKKKKKETNDQKFLIAVTHLIQISLFSCQTFMTKEIRYICFVFGWNKCPYVGSLWFLFVLYLTAKQNACEMKKLRKCREVTCGGVCSNASTNELFMYNSRFHNKHGIVISVAPTKEKAISLLDQKWWTEG